MTRHGMVQTSAAGTQPPATGPRALMVIIEVETAAPRPSSRQNHGVEEQRNGLSASIPALPSGRRANADISPGVKSP